MRYAFNDKICVVTGAASGIGRALAIELAAKGASLALSDVNFEGLQETADLAGVAGSNRVRLDRLDVADPSAIAGYAATVKDSLGPADYLFNVAGISRLGRFRDTPLPSFEKVIDVNLWGVVRMTKAFLPQLLETQGAVVNISSIFGMIGVPGQAHYCASKFAVRGFSEALAQELAEAGVRIASVHPGGVKTNITRNAEVDALPKGAASKSDVDALFDKFAITSPERAAETILKGVARGERRIIVGRDAHLMSAVQRLFPRRYQHILKLYFPVDAF